ncbi:ABC transporter permease [Pseudochelatococcus sp. G4_1912]|uniref:ABC transporter permease n=1 Tax=Pseudochelatococcus sp. G4_1912 TaxID=3114288 RepID=UPI0039C66462
MNRQLYTGLIIVLGIGACALLSLAWTPYNPLVLNIPDKFAEPSLSHWLGTDQLGRDVLSLIMRGAVGSVSVALIAVLLGLMVGVPLGMLAAQRRGLSGNIVMRMSDFLFAFPTLITAILLREIVGPGVINAAVAIGLFNVPVFARVTYSAALPIWGSSYVLAARVAGRESIWIGGAHVLPNIANTLIVQATIQLSLGVLAEASLSYIGLGVQPPQPSWGRMLFEAQTLMAISPRLAIVPGLAIVITVLGLNLTGQGLRQALDPRRESRS